MSTYNYLFFIKKYLEELCVNKFYYNIIETNYETKNFIIFLFI